MIVAETKEEEQGVERNANNMTTYTFIQPTITTNTPIEKTDIANERRIYLDSLTDAKKI